MKNRIPLHPLEEMVLRKYNIPEPHWLLAHAWFHMWIDLILYDDEFRGQMKGWIDSLEGGRYDTG